MDKERKEKSLELEEKEHWNTEIVANGKLTPYGEKKYKEYIEDSKEWFYDEEQGKWIHV